MAKQLQGDAPGRAATGSGRAATRAARTTPSADERRIGSRARVELEARWRPVSSTKPPTLVMLFDLSVRGARLAGWNPLHLSVGDQIELSIDRRTTWRAEVRRVVGDGEYAVQFHDVPPAVKQRLINTVGLAKAGRGGAWADA